jgi:DNA-binding NtrC family response regulator/sarcosine oxidase delta subunit
VTSGRRIRGESHEERPSEAPADVHSQSIDDRGDFGFARTVPRTNPQLHWSDAAGSHSYLMVGRLVVGSAENADVVVRGEGVSRLHASLEIKDDGVWVRDLGSRDGTYIDGIKVIEARIPHGGTLALGSTGISLRYNEWITDVVLWPADHFGPLVGRSTKMRELFARLHRVAQGEATVLIFGETGTGKELAARAIHAASPRRGAPFIVVDCGALSESLLEAELFGHARGAFTGAASARVGAIEAADGGTVFLDEIGEMPLSMQPRLLRAIEGHTVRRVGENEHRKVNVRFLAATHRDLAAMVNAGSFREDLFFRLAVLPVHIPALRERREDITVLAERLMAPETRERLSPELVRELSSRAWPGNVRELRNFLERAAALGAREALAMGSHGARDLSEPSTVAPTPSISPLPRDAAPVARDGLPPVSVETSFKVLRDQWLEHLQREYLSAMLARYGRDTGAIAQAAGLDRKYVYTLLRKHDL